jgi:hypothetical protein
MLRSRGLTERCSSMQRRTILLFILLLTLVLLYASVTGRSARELASKQRSQTDLLEHLDERVLEPEATEQEGAEQAVADDRE